MKKIKVILLSTLLLFACKKEDIQPETIAIFWASHSAVELTGNSIGGRYWIYKGGIPTRDAQTTAFDNGYTIKRVRVDGNREHFGTYETLSGYEGDWKFTIKEGEIKILDVSNLRGWE